jgi:ketosteroid isomerase-like protein
MAEIDTEQASKAASKVKEAAANIHRPAAGKRRGSGGEAASGTGAESVARRYFEAIDAHDVDLAVSMWAPGGREYVRGQVDVRAPEGVREFIGALVGAMPDMKMVVVETTTEGERCAVQWQITGTFAGPESFNGLAPTGSPVALEGVDVLSVRDGLIQGNEAFTDGLTFAREIGMMPPQGSSAG